MFLQQFIFAADSSKETLSRVFVALSIEVAGCNNCPSSDGRKSDRQRWFLIAMRNDCSIRLVTLRRRLIEWTILLAVSLWRNHLLSKHFRISTHIPLLNMNSTILVKKASLWCHHSSPISEWIAWTMLRWHTTYWDKLISVDTHKQMDRQINKWRQPIKYWNINWTYVVTLSSLPAYCTIK